MLAKAGHEERMLFNWLDHEIVNLPSITDAFNESGKLPKETPRPLQLSRITIVTSTSVGRMFSG